MKHTRLGSAKKGLACANVKYSLLVATVTGKFINDTIFRSDLSISQNLLKNVSRPINIKYGLSVIVGVTKDTTTIRFVSLAHVM